MVRVVFLFAVSAAGVIGLLSFVAIHVEAMIYTRSLVPTDVFPIDALRGRGQSIGLVLAAGIGAAAHDFIFRRLFVQRWGLVNELQYNKSRGKA